MSVSRTALRAIATAVASAALVGAAAMPALADGGGHHRGNRIGYSHGYRPIGFRGHHDGDHDRFGYWDRGRYHRWYGTYDRDDLGDLLRLLALRHGWYGDRYHHGHYWGR
ncbi:hypothetical protein ABZ845_10300 [Streptomyces sp. NPDC047022]|uniref:hypothetical protein n=1 Tax=Streptomyces sp. NPDC047022 TaxID=3155737 RepID=UPI00340F227E